MSEQPKKTPFPISAVDEPKLRLYATYVREKNPPALKINIAKNQPRISVYTNVEGDPNGGMVMARMDTFTMYAVLHALSLVIEEKEVRFDIPCKRPVRSEVIGNPDWVIESHVTIGREEDGNIFIAVVGNSVTPIKFYFGPTKFHDTWLANKQPMSTAAISNIYANAWGKVFATLIATGLERNHTPPEPRVDYKNKPNNGYNKPSAYADTNKELGDKWNPPTNPSNDFGGSDADFPV